MEDRLAALQEVITCAICLETLTPPVVQCGRGHALCRGCKRNQRHCPSCQQPFLPYRPTLLSQILEVFAAGRCKFRGCTQRVENAQEHETWCGYRPANCKLCQRTGSGKDLLSHIQSSHRDTLLTSNTVNFAKIMRNCIALKVFNLPFSAHGLLFWIELKILNLSWNNSGLLVLKATFVPTGTKSLDGLFLQVCYKSDKCAYDVKKKIETNATSDTLEFNSVFIPELEFGGPNHLCSINIVKNGEYCGDGLRRNVTGTNFYLDCKNIPTQLFRNNPRDWAETTQNGIYWVLAFCTKIIVQIISLYE